jgi:hypothetical protein
MHSISHPLTFRARCAQLLRFTLCLTIAAFALPGVAHAGDKKSAESAATALSAPLERDGYAFRAESWTRDLSSKMGRAVRVQLFKGNDYRFCVAVPMDSGVKITAAVLDFDGKPRGDLKPIDQGWGLVLSFKPKKTGVYAVAIRQVEGGKTTTVPCSVITGYR